MKRFVPIDNGINGSIYGLLSLSWKSTALLADFGIEDNEKDWLRVSFDRAEIVRILDEFPLSTEEEWHLIPGHVAGQFAYRVEESHFWLSQSEAFRLSFSHCHHFQFVTPDMCLDVIAEVEPVFSLTAARWEELDS